MNQYSVKILSILWMDRDNPEAEVLFELDGKQFSAFSHPCNFSEGEIARVTFDFIQGDISDVAFWEENREHKKDILPLNSNRWSYACYGQVKSLHNTIIDCGPIEFSLGDFLNDQRTIGAYVYFAISRLDIKKVTR